MINNNLSFFIFYISIFISCQTDKQVSKYPNYVGDIEFDEKTDNKDFKLCFPNKIYQYFNNSKGLEYEGEKIAIDKIFFENYNSKNVKKESGSIRIRFVVNCNGETDRFRLLEMDENYQEKTFDSTITKQLMAITKSLKGWKPKEFYGFKSNYYQYLIFKIENGNLIEIMPWKI